MLLTEKQTDALTEIINISFSRAAFSLSELTGHRVIVDVPHVEIHPIEELGSVLKNFINDEVTTVHQIFSGELSGDAMMILSRDGSLLLSNLLTDDVGIHSSDLNTSLQEVVTEVGNILLNACLGSFGNLLKVQLSFSVPSLHLDSLDGLMKSIILDNSGLNYAIVVFMEFKLKDNSISGYLVVVLGVTSLELFIKEIEKLG